MLSVPSLGRLQPATFLGMTLIKHSVTPLVLSLAFSLALVPSGLLLRGATPLPEGGDSIIRENATTANPSFWPGSFEGAPVASSAVVDVDHPDFDKALRVTVTNPAGGQYWNGALQIPSTQSVAQGDVLLVRLFFRSIESKDESGVGFATVFTQGPAPGFNKYLTREITATQEWTEYLLPFEMTEAQPSGSLSLQVGAGAGTKTQIWEVAGIEMLNYQNNVALQDLPVTRPTYTGRDPDAPWRAQAAARIEQHRKGDFSVTVLDDLGNPVPGLPVSVNLKQHAYHFGSVIVASRIMGTGSDNGLYREKFLELFNQSGTENDLKWAPWAGEWGSSFNPDQTIAALQWLRDRNIYTRGHVMVWPSKRNLPNLIQSYLPADNPTAADPAAKQVVLDHIDDIASRTKAYLDEWDVLNEPFDNHYLMDAFGDQVMVDWFARARINLPRHRLYINDYGILSAGGRDGEHQQHLEDTVQYLISNDAPIDGIGMQGHFSASPTSIELLYEILERFHQKFPGLKIRVTEFDVSTDDEEMQADYTRDFLTLLFSHPATVGVQCWGFWEGAHWRPIAAMYTTDWREKPNAVAWKEMTREVWWNDFDGVTDSQGRFSGRGFYGDYTVSIQVEGTNREFEFPLVKEGPDQIVIRLPDSIEIDPGKAVEVKATGSLGSPRIRIAEYEGERYYIETSSNLRHWRYVSDFNDHTPGVSYLFGINPESRLFYRLVKKD